MASAEMMIFVPAAIRAVMAGLAPRLDAAAGGPVFQMIDLNPAIPERITNGEAFDIALTNPGYVAPLIAAGLADGSSHRAFGRVPLAVGQASARAGDLRTDVRDIVEMFLAADSIAYTGAGTSGRIFLQALKDMGLTDDVLSRCHPMDGGAPAASAAAGKADLAIAPLTTLRATPGVTAVAIFPEALNTHIDMSVFLHPQPRDGAAQVLRFLVSEELDQELSEAGLERFTLA